MRDSITIAGRDKVETLGNDIERVLHILPVLEHLANIKAKNISPAIEPALDRLKKLRDHIKGEDT